MSKTLTTILIATALGCSSPSFAVGVGAPEPDGDAEADTASDTSPADTAPDTASDTSPADTSSADTAPDTASDTSPADTSPDAPDGPSDALAAPSCVGGLTCGSRSCCEALAVPGGAFLQGRGASTDACPPWAWGGVCEAAELPEHTTTVSPFRLDTFEVTVGRFRAFVAAYPTSRPAPGAGAHPKIAGSGWSSSWAWALPADAAALRASLACGSAATWTDSPTSSEQMPITCADWYLAFAFCAWDGGRLPTEAEWEYAAAGGSENRLTPWGANAPDCGRANNGTCGGYYGLVPVGSYPSGAARWGHLDMAGNAEEWVLDAMGAYPTACSDCATLTGPARVVRGGSFVSEKGSLRAAARDLGGPTGAVERRSFRCARGG